MRARILKSLGLNLVAAYAPFLWVVLIDYPWNEYRWLWVKMYPILPGLVPVELPRAMLGLPRWGDGTMMVSAGAATLAMLTVATAAGASGRTPGRARLCRAAAAAVLLAGCSASSLATYGLFRA